MPIKNAVLETKKVSPNADVAIMTNLDRTNIGIVDDIT